MLTVEKIESIKLWLSRGIFNGAKIRRYPKNIQKDDVDIVIELIDYWFKSQKMNNDLQLQKTKTESSAGKGHLS